MASVNRFIQFNNETVNTRTLLRLERLARALAGAPYLKMTTRKLIEFRPSESAISLSVFWRHRQEHIEMYGYLSDVYLLSAGYWRHFNFAAYRRWATEHARLPSLRMQLLLCAEEFRLSELIMEERPGTKEAFRVRENVYRDFHETQYEQNRQKGFYADAFLNAAYLTLHGTQKTLEDPQLVLYLWTELFDARTTADSMRVIDRIVVRLEHLLEKDMVHDFYTFGENPDKAPPVHEHEGARESEVGSDEKIETIEEWFQTWHRETEETDAPAMEYELNEGKSMIAEGGREEEGTLEEELQTAKGRSDGDHLADNEAEDRRMNSAPKPAKGKYGPANDQVEFTEKRLIATSHDLRKIEHWRMEQAPYVKALLKELRKRIEQRREQPRALSAGRLSKNLLPLIVDERPKPFYRKTSPSKNLDAVFSLLVDGSASMVDKLEETKQAVLLFHDVLRGLGIPHEIVLFYEDAYEAEDARQPNYFEWVHKFEDGQRDAASSIDSIEAHEDNRDGFAIRWMTERMLRRNEKHRFLLVFSDGEPSAYNYADNGILDTAEAVEEAEKAGVTLLHLFLSDSVPGEDQQRLFRMMYGNRSVTADSFDRFTEQTLHLLRRTLHIIVQSS